MKFSIGIGCTAFCGSLSLILASCSSGSASPPPLGWVPTFAPAATLDEEVHIMTVFDDGSGGGPALFVGGDFLTAGGLEVNHIGKWNGSTWSALGAGTNDPVQALKVFDDGSGGGPALFVGGVFSSAGGQPIDRIAKWDGSAWSAMGLGMNASVLALEVFDDGSGDGPALHAAGSFTTAGGLPANGVAKWDGSGWLALETGMNGSVHALAVFDDGSGGGPALYASGPFTTAGGKEVNRIARWDGSTWSALGAGMNNGVSTVVVFDDGSGAGPALYAGGLFTTAGGVEVNHIARWGGSTWSPLGSGMDDPVRALAGFDDGSGGGPALYAGGSFTVADGVESSRIAKWDGSAWSALGAGSSNSVFALGVFDDGTSSGGVLHGPSLFVGGSFTESPAGDPFLAKWGRSHAAVLFGPEVSLALTDLPPDPEEQACALTARIGDELRLDDPGLHLLLEHAHVAPPRNLQWLAGTIELRGGLWREEEAIVLGIAGPARLVLAEGARLEIPRVIVGSQGELRGEGLLLGDLENQGLVAPSGSGFELYGSYLESPPGTLSGAIGSESPRTHLKPSPAAR